LFWYWSIDFLAFSFFADVLDELFLLSLISLFISLISSLSWKFSFLSLK
jgi:hypothetical protein